ncbi:MAG TPA: FAD-dependent oxidoreductase [Peptococcaceae bacterium]|nr:FAD-dependent oxidoreductase [Peptococcaceae bacterium]
MVKKDVLIIGGGPAGLAAAVKLKKLGVESILILERENHLGGILRQCIHDGFGLTRFKEALSGPEYAARFVAEVQAMDIAYETSTTVLEITADKKVTAVSQKGLQEYQAKAIILTTGCRERTRGAISIPGTRPAGVYTAGVAQAYVNLKNIMVGKRIIILGSGDIGLIMARRMTLEGAKVEAVLEILPYPSGLPRNIEQCLNDYNIPLFLSHTVTDIKGKARLEGVTVSQVDEQFKPIPGTERDYACDTLILSVGLIPENELALMAGVELDSRTKGAIVDENYQTNIEGIFAAGNALHVHDLVDYVSLEAENLAEAVAEYLRQGSLPPCPILIETDSLIGYTVPQKISGLKDFQLSLRVKKPFQNCSIQISQNGELLKAKKMRKALPAEMIQIKVIKSDFLTNEIANLRISVANS